MNFYEVDIFYFYTGWNHIYPDVDLDVDSNNGAFTWRRRGSTITPPLNSAIIAHLYLDREDDPVNTIAFAIIDYLPNEIDGAEAIRIAAELMEKINAQRSTLGQKPAALRAATVLNFLEPLSDSVTE